MAYSRTKNRYRSWRLLSAFPVISMFALALLLAACGGATTGATTAPSAGNAAAGQSFASNHSVSDAKAAVQPDAANQNANNPKKQSQGGQGGQQYLIKSLAVTMELKNTTRVATDLLTWVTTTDPLATSAGTDYQQVGDNLYRIALTFSVSAKAYSQVYQYLRDYAPAHQGKMTGFQEQVQDVSNDYIDTSSQLTNLKKEQARIQTLMGQAQNLNDVVVLESKLTDIEGRIENIEAHLNSLNAQTSFYKVTVNLYPTEAPPPPPPPSSSWSFGQVMHDAFAASLSFAQGLLTFIVWLLAFSVYIIPAGLLIWGVMKLRTRFQHVTPPPADVK